MRTYSLALLGFGGVNRALAQLLVDGPTRFALLGFEIKVVAITDLAMGSLIQDSGIDLREVLNLPAGLTFKGFPGGSETADSERAIRDSLADIVIEATFTNPIDGEPATSYIRSALELGKSVATTNKGPIALHGAALRQLAAEHNAFLAFEGAVLSGTPLLGLVRDQLSGLTVRGFEGVLNGTSNYVIGRMEAGLSLESAVAEAQVKGYAEADPVADIGGSDVQLKVAILANELLGASIVPSDVGTTGISGLTARDLASATSRGTRYKLIGSAHREADGRVVARVSPQELALDHPLASITGATNAVAIDTDLLGTVTISGPGAGRTETAFALIADLITIDEHRKGEHA